MITKIKTQDITAQGRKSKGLIIGNRIPMDYFETTGIGESDITVHAGSYHLALKDAGIEQFNIMTYSSILPGIARRIDKPERIEHGSVVESIMAVCTTEKGQRATAGIIYGWLYDRENGSKFGGLVCENYGQETEDEISLKLRASLDELYYNGFSERYFLKDIHTLTKSFVPEKKHGTALVALCFTSYYYPIIEGVA